MVPDRAQSRQADSFLRQQLKRLENRAHRDDSRLTMKSQLIAIVAAVLVVGCATTQQPKPPTAKAPDISIHDAAREGNIEAVKQHLAAGTKVDAVMGFDGRTPLLGAVRKGHKEIAELLIANGADVNAKNYERKAPLDFAVKYKRTEIADLLRKHGGKTGEELKAEGK